MITEKVLEIVFKRMQDAAIVFEKFAQGMGPRLEKVGGEPTENTFAVGGLYTSSTAPVRNRGMGSII